jgi:NifU-like protein involved in Fe-S cluster formation
MTNEVITYYSKNPPNKFEMTDYTVKNAEDNRNCSDTMEVFLKIED